MTSNQFFIGHIDPQISSVFLEGEEHHHLSRVVRIKAGDEVWLFDKDGNRCLALVETVGRAGTRLRIIKSIEAERPRINLTLGQAWIKNLNMDLILQKSAELGIAAFVPLVTARSIQKRGVEAEKKIERWRKIVREAAKQSKRSEVPSLECIRSLKEFVSLDSGGRKFFLNERGGKYLRDILADAPARDRAECPEAVLLLVGPEGGWTEDEEETLIGREFEPISLGKTIVRAETAAILAVGMIAHYWNYWNS